MSTSPRASRTHLLASLGSSLLGRTRSLRWGPGLKLLPFPLREGSARSDGGRYLFFLALLFALPAHAAPPPTVTPADAPAIKRAIAAEKGHVVLVNFWATWCGPCVAEFPAIVGTGRKYKAAGLRVITVSADPLKDKDAKVRLFLMRSGAEGPAYLEQSRDPEEFINAFDPAWQGDLPRTLIYDRAGRRVKTLVGEQTAQSLAAAVTPYLRPMKAVGTGRRAKKREEVNFTR